MIIEKISERLLVLESDDPKRQFRHDVIEKVIKKILNGDSILKKYLSSNAIKMIDVVRAIKYKRCLSAPDQDIGHTYLEQILGSIIRDIISIENINAAREIFGLDNLPPSELVKQKKASIKQKMANQANRKEQKHQ